MKSIHEQIRFEQWSKEHKKAILLAVEKFYRDTEIRNRVFDEAIDKERGNTPFMRRIIYEALGEKFDQATKERDETLEATLISWFVF